MVKLSRGPLHLACPQDVRQMSGCEIEAQGWEQLARQRNNASLFILLRRGPTHYSAVCLDTMGMQPKVAARRLLEDMSMST